MSRSKIQVPVIEGMVSSRPYSSAWLDRAGTTWNWLLPHDCRAISKRISVLLWDDGIGSEVKVIEGDGRKPGFKEHARVVMPDGAGPLEAHRIATGLMDAHFDTVAPDPAKNPEGHVAGILVASGFLEDDWIDGTVWLRPADVEGFTWYVRGEGEIHFPVVNGCETPVSVPGEVHPDLPCEVGIVSDGDDGRNFVVATSVDEAVRIVNERLLPLPAVDEVRAFAIEDLFGAPSP